VKSERKPEQPPVLWQERCRLEVDLAAIRENYRAASRMVGEKTKIIPVLKADAYGMGAPTFTRTVYNNTFSYELPRTAREQFQQGEEVDDISRLKFGDLIFFNTRRSVKPGHVGIYLGDNLFAHSSSRQGVMVSSLNMEYYNKRFMGGRRFENLTVK
jgi:cell wall-associated NlpC family hydrolase